MAGKKKRPTALSILREIERISEKSEYYQSRQSGKRFYEPLKLPSILLSYVKNGDQSVSQIAATFGMSSKTLTSILSGGPLSENMLFRIRSAMALEVASIEKRATFPGEWRKASPQKVATAIAGVSDRLVFLKKVIEQSNFLHSEDSPIDKIQVLQLIALLAATLEALRAPFVDKKQTGGFFSWLKKLTKTSIEKGIEKSVADAMSDAVKSGADLMEILSAQPNMSDLGDIWS